MLTPFVLIFVEAFSLESAEDVLSAPGVSVNPAEISINEIHRKMILAFFFIG
jgi:hypothetical protein